MPLSPPPPAGPKPAPPAPPAPPAAPVAPPASVPPPASPQPSHESHNPGPVAPSLPPLEPKHTRSAAPAIVAVLIVLLAAVGVGAYFLQPKKQALQPSPVTEVTPTPFFLQVQSPNGETGIVAGEILVAGQTFPNTPLSIYSDIDDAAVQSDGSGHFETTVMVGEDGGAVRVIAYNVNGEETSATIDVGGQAVLGKSDAPGQQKKEEASVTVSNQGNGNSADKSNNGAKSDTTASQNVNGNGNANDNSQKEKPAGAAASIAVATTAKNKQASKEQTDPAAFLKVKVKETVTAKLGPEKIKELLGNPAGSESARLAMKMVEARPASAGAQMKRHGIMGVITAVTDSSVIVMHQNKAGQTDTILYNINTIIQSESDKSGTAAAFAVGQRINAVGYPSAQGLLATRIHIIPGEPVNVSAVFRLAPTGTATDAAGSTSSAAPVLTVTPAATATPSVQPTLLPAAETPAVPEVSPTVGAAQ